jgi:hypothetical protein
MSITAPALMDRQQSTPVPTTVVAAQEIDETRICDVLEYCSKQLGLQDLACLAASSKQYNEASAATAAKGAALLLENALTAARAVACDKSAASPSLQQHMQAAAWLLRVAPSATTGSHSSNAVAVHPKCATTIGEAAVGSRCAYEVRRAYSSS